VERRRDSISAADALTAADYDMVQQFIGTADAPIDTAALSDEVARRLRREIFSGFYAGGETLKQLHVAARLGTSAVPVREAFQRLIAEGLLVPHRHRGVVVARLSKTDIVDIAELRILLEPQAMRLSAPQLTAADLAEATRILKVADQTRDGVDRSERHWAFHRLLYSRADRPRLLETIDKLYLSINRYLLNAWTHAGLSPDWHESHDAILDRLRAQRFDDAVDMIRAQVVAASERVIGFLEGHNDDLTTGKRR
jgi:DNA-binding GntR family transcriptional regulator